MRVPVVLRVSKGVLAPTFGFVATRLVRTHDVVHLHLPQFDAPGVALRARLMRKPVVLTYHCDLRLPSGALNRVIDRVVKVQNNLAALLADHLVTYTQDYADHSTYLTRYGSRLTPILPPVAVEAAPPERVAAFAAAAAARRPPTGDRDGGALCRRQGGRGPARRAAGDPRTAIPARSCCSPDSTAT